MVFMNPIKISMPSNIALIKYMGKINSAQNLPTNASLSYTLNHLLTTVTLTPIDADQDSWDDDVMLNAQEKQRFLQHLQFIKSQFSCQINFQVHSENNFPANCGLASSASSFAALTACAVKACGISLTAEELAALSRQGSGSSCRSFFGPWVLWTDDVVQALSLPYPDLQHCVIVVSREKKVVSSSLAHQRVISSLLFTNRAQRAEMRLEKLTMSLQQHDWEQAYYLCWQEFWDMHALFETCDRPFGYLLPESVAALLYLQNFWGQHQDGPLITMDAGPNIHLLFRADQTQMMAEIKQFFAGKII
jgi:diphosphomevalonate decarboxylase